jgi:hypothetical protein
MKRKLMSFILLCGISGQSIMAQDSAMGDMGLESSLESSPTLFFHELKLKTAEVPGVRHESATGQSEEMRREILNNNTKTFLASNALYTQLVNYSEIFGNKFADYIGKGEIVTGYQMHLLIKIFSAYHMLSIKNVEYADYYTPGDKNSSTFLDPANPENTKRQLIWLAARMSVINNLWRGYQTYYKREGKVRRMMKSIYKINKHTEIFTNEMKDLVGVTFSKKAQKELNQTLLRYENKRPQLTLLAEQDPQIANLLSIIDNNGAYATIKKGTKLKLKNYSVVDGLVKLSGDIVNALSGFFGNIAGAMRWRKGYLWHNQAMVEEIESTLKPLDMIFEKTPFALTDKFIPGHFGHAAIWLGTEQELKDLGMWDHPLIAPYQEQISRGYSIVEALRPGVSMNSVRGFSNIDHIAIVRAKNILSDKSVYSDVYESALRNIGKDYDFNFDVTTADKIVCSELLYNAFGHIKFPTKFRLGRSTIEPDLIAEVNFYDNSPTEFKSYIESFAIDKIENAGEEVLGERLGFAINKERSTSENTAYDRVSTSCRLVQRPVRDARLVGANSTLDRNKKEIVKVCIQQRTLVEYVAPENLAQDLFSQPE